MVSERARDFFGARGGEGDDPERALTRTPGCDEGGDPGCDIREGCVSVGGFSRLGMGLESTLLALFLRN